MTHVVLTVFALFALGLLLIGAWSTGKQWWFVLRARKVNGRVVSEWRYRQYGTHMRTYRVEVTVSTGQRITLRSAGARASFGPKVGALVPVLLLEQTGHGPKARIASWIELWLLPATLLGLGGMTTIFVVFAAAQVFGF